MNLRFARHLAERLVPPLILLLLGVLVWEGVVRMFRIPRYILPGPGKVAAAAAESAGMLARATVWTTAGALCGFLASLLIGTAIALVFSQSRRVRVACYPYAVFLQTVPIIAIAPLIIIWLGYGFAGMVAVAFIVSLFPIITNATAGLLAVDPDLLELFRLHRASRLQTLFRLRIPNAIPSLITGARISSGASVIGAIVGEYFAGFGSGRFGLGYLIMQTSQQLKTDLLLATVFASTLCGVAIFGAVTLLGERILSRWYDVTAETPAQ